MSERNRTRLDARSLNLGATFVILSMIGCASTWSYTHYTLDVTALPEPQKGMVRAVNPKDDFDLTKCLPSATSKAPCNLLMESEYFRLKADYLAMEKRLIACEQRQ
jgi:hypothetical protein